MASPLNLRNVMEGRNMSKQTTERSTPPRFGTKKPKFYCPLSPDILWHHGLVYKECPLCEEQRDMPACAKCKLKGESKVKPKYKKKYKNRNKKDIPKVEKRGKEPIPKIGKTYTSE